MSQTATKTRSGGGEGGLLGRILTTLAAAAGAATAITGLVFFAGYVAVKQHDASLGIITTTTPSAYPRVGLDFFYRSVGALYEYGSQMSPESRKALIFIVAGFLFVGAAYAEPLLSTRKKLSTATRVGVRTVLHLSFAFLLFYSLPWYLAPMKPRLQSLIFITPAADSAKRAGADSTRLATGGPIAPEHPHVDSIYNLLHTAGGEPVLFSIYGKHLALALTALAGAWVLGGIAKEVAKPGESSPVDPAEETAAQRGGSAPAARQNDAPEVVAQPGGSDAAANRLNDAPEILVQPGGSAAAASRPREVRESGSPSLAALSFWQSVDRHLARPLVILFVIMMIVHLPALYGVLAIPNRYPCVRVDTAVVRVIPPPTPRPSGARGASLPAVRSAEPEDRYLLSDLSTDAKDVALFKPEITGRYRMEFYPRDKVRTITGLGCASRSILERRSAKPFVVPTSNPNPQDPRP